MLKMRNRLVTVGLWVLLISIFLIPLIVIPSAPFLGADDQAGKLIEQLSPNYEPWASPLWVPPSGEIASLLFALQASLGAGLFGYGLAYLKWSRRPGSKEPLHQNQVQSASI